MGQSLLSPHTSASDTIAELNSEGINIGNLSFRVNVSIDPETGSPRAAYMQIRVGFAETTRELIPGKALADYSETGDLLGIEFLAPCASIEVLDKLSPSEPQPVLRFLQGSVPFDMVR